MILSAISTIGQYHPGISYLQNHEFQRNTRFFTFYEKLLLLLTQLNFTALVKMNLYERLRFFSILAIRKTEILWTIFFLGLDYSCKYTHNKMSNQESEDVLYWRLGKLDCNATMGNEQLGILHHPQNRSFGNTEESTFELLAIGHHEYWTAA